MLKVEEALERLMAAQKPGPGVAEIALSESLGRVLAQDMHACIDVPPADNSAMDGYAFRYSDAGAPGAKLAVSQRIAAGHVPCPLQPGTAARIFTGAEIPSGADTVVMQEDCDATETHLTIRELPEKHANVRPRAQDIASGQKLLGRGQRLRAQDLGLLASQGLASVKAFEPLKVALLSTGDELVEPGRSLAPGQIYNSNRYTLMSLLRGWGFEVVDLGIAPDQPDAIRELFRKAANQADVIVSSGGVSVGEEDHVKAVVAELGSLDLWRIAIKPGKPFAFGNILGKPFLGLPGNPVSVFVTLLIIGRPYLFACQGIQADPLPVHPGTALFAKPGSSREDYLRVRQTANGLELFSSQSSGVLLSTSQSDGLVRQPVGQDIQPGDVVDFIPYGLLT